MYSPFNFEDAIFGVFCRRQGVCVCVCVRVCVCVCARARASMYCAVTDSVSFCHNVHVLMLLLLPMS